MTMGDEEKKQSKADKLRAKAVVAVDRAFRMYQEWQLELSRERAMALDPGDEQGFIEWIKEDRT